MTSSPDKTIAAKQKKQKFWQKILLFIGAGSFLATAMIPLVMSFTQPKPEPVATTPQEESADQLKQQETGFVQVLAKEPENPNALQGLVQTRLKLGDLAGSVDPLKKLIKLYPDEKVLKDLLVQVEDQLAKAPAKTSPTTAPANTDPKTTTP